MGLLRPKGELQASQSQFGIRCKVNKNSWWFCVRQHPRTDPQGGFYYKKLSRTCTNSLAEARDAYIMANAGDGSDGRDGIDGRDGSDASNVVPATLQLAKPSESKVSYRKCASTRHLTPYALDLWAKAPFSVGRNVMATLRKVGCNNRVVMMTLSSTSPSDVVDAWRAGLTNVACVGRQYVSSEAGRALEGLRDKLREKTPGWYGISAESGVARRVRQARARDLDSAVAKPTASHATVEQTKPGHPAASGTPQEVALMAVSTRRLNAGAVIGLYNGPGCTLFAETPADCERYECDASRAMVDGSFAVDIGEGRRLVMDVTPLGNPLAAVNAPSPGSRSNCDFVTVFRKLDSGEVRPYVALVASRAIDQGVELRASYGPDYWDQWAYNEAERLAVRKRAREGDERMTAGRISAHEYADGLVAAIGSADREGSAGCVLQAGPVVRAGERWFLRAKKLAKC